MPLDDVSRRMEVVRLGQGVDRTGMFDPDALARTLKVIGEYGDECRAAGVESIRFAATSATRDASNRQVFIDGVRERLGIEPQVLSGIDEATTSFAGAVSVVDESAPSPLIAVDLGGGSTEIALGTTAGEVISSWSMDVGCVRMRERHLVSDPLTDAQIAAARADVRAALDAAEQHVDLGSARGLIGLAGTVTTITAHALGLTEYDPDRIHGAEIALDDVRASCDWFISSTAEQRSALGFMHPGRVDVIHAGALVWREVVDRIALRMSEAGHPLTHVMTSEHDILDGLALWAAREPQHFA